MRVMRSGWALLVLGALALGACGTSATTVLDTSPPSADTAGEAQPGDVAAPDLADAPDAAAPAPDIAEPDEVGDLPGAEPAAELVDTSEPDASEPAPEVVEETAEEVEPGAHPVGWVDPAQHGLAAKLAQSDCRTCHGADLLGGESGVSCDSCHPPGWRATCTFCHGGGETDEGAPPRDLDGTTTTTDLSFPPHTAHVTATTHVAYECEQCHLVPQTLTAPGHLFDGTPGVAEVSFVDGLSKAGVYTAPGACASLYCHGNGRSTPGAAIVGGPPLGCASCHPHTSSSGDAWAAMSGYHKKHLEKGVGCQACHASVTADGATIKNPPLHVDGERSVTLQSGISWNGSTCSGFCHSKLHIAYGW